MHPLRVYRQRMKRVIAAAALTLDEPYIDPAGITITLTDFTAGTIDSDYPGTDMTAGDPAVYLTVTVDNGSPDLVDATLLDIIATEGMDGQDVEVLKAAEFTPSIDGPVPPGKSDSQQFALLADPDSLDDVTLIVSGWSYDAPAVFAGDVTAELG